MNASGQLEQLGANGDLLGFGAFQMNVESHTLLFYHKAKHAHAIAADGVRLQSDI